MSSGDVADAGAEGVGGAPPDQAPPDEAPPEGAPPDEAPVIDAEPAHRLTATLFPQWATLPVHGAPRVRGAFRAPPGVDDAPWARGRGWAQAAPVASLPLPDDSYSSSDPARTASPLRRLEESVADG
ncbi:hypothetical protein [Streptomyces sp. 3N207]|uniref:hypothetical protein n=1 Tax=Streptomyces sp. 3N207 TaxID=3457417 RepID=UPI003FD51878